jgi:hypothetical protein
MRTGSIWRLLAGGVVAAALAATVLAAPLAAPALADQPQTQTYFICPSVGTNNPAGMWVIGFHGAYYVNIPTQGPTGDKVFLTVPVTVASLAQIPAGWGLYNDLPSYPNFAGTAMLLAEGIEHWLGSPSGWNEGDMATVLANPDGTYTVTDLNLTINNTVTIGAIPLESAAVW